MSQKMAVLSTAANEYFKRPKDERFPSLGAMVNVAQHERELSVERSYNLKDLRAVVHNDGVRVESPKGIAKFTHWAFGQFARMVGAPAAYLRELPPTIAADCLNFGISGSEVGSTATMLVKAPNGDPMPTVRSMTSESYDRVWDSELYGAIQRQIVDVDDKWTLPPTWDGVPAGAYRGDRDSFLILTNGGSIVNDPSVANGNGAMYRGLLVRHSEVGASAAVIERILYEYVCGNHNLWGAVIDKSYRRRHVGTKTLRDTIREIGNIAHDWTSRPASADEAIIRSLVSHELAATKDAIVDELRAMGATKEQATDAYDRCESKFNASPRSFWGISQGLTSLSQDSGYQDDRYAIDQIAAKVLARGSKLVAA